MLRSGYSSEAVLRELWARKFAGTLDSAGEKQLSRAGATQSLILALRSGSYQATTAPIATLKKQTAFRDQERSATAPLAGDVPRATSSPADKQVGGNMYEHLKGDLVYWHNGSLVPIDNEALEKKKFYLLFFSALWSKEGRQFTARLIDYYNRQISEHPEFEVIFFSVDRSAFAMENYISQTNMPWPALAYDKRNGKAGAIQGNLVEQIPHLILADATGKILSDSGNNQPNFDKVLADLDRVLAGN